MLKSILFTHDDLDGAGCRIIYELIHMNEKKGEDFLVVNCSNATINTDVTQTILSAKPEINKSTEICFADIVASNEVLSNIKEIFSDIKIWDHHRTNFPCQHIIPNATIVPENELGVLQSGTSLIYQYYASKDDAEIFKDKYNQKMISLFVDKVRSYDTYEFKETGDVQAKELRTLFFMLGMNRFCDRYVKLLSTEGYDGDLIMETDMDFVLGKLEDEQKIIDSITPDDVYQITIRGYKTAFLLGSRGANISELAHQFLTNYPEFDIFASFVLRKNAEFQFRTIRSDIDLGEEVAVPIGGGGHPKAAGASLKEEIIDKFMDMLVTTLNE